MTDYTTVGSGRKTFTVRPELMFIKRAELLVTQQREWCEFEQRKTPLAQRIKSTLIPEICKNTLESLREPRTRLLLVISGLAGRHQGDKFEHLVRHLVIMGNRSGYPRLRNTRRSLAEWDETSRYDKSIMVADAAITLPGYDIHHVTLNMSDSIREDYRKQEKPLNWMRARINRNLKAIADKANQEPPMMFLTEETTEKEFEHFHFLLVHKGLKKKHIKHALKLSGGKDYVHVRGKAQSVMRSVPTHKDAIRVCNYLMKQDHNYYLNRDLMRLAKARYDYYKQLLTDITGTVKAEISTKPAISATENDDSSKGTLSTRGDDSSVCAPHNGSTTTQDMDKQTSHPPETKVLEKNVSPMRGRDHLRDEISKFRTEESSVCIQPDHKEAHPRAAKDKREQRFFELVGGASKMTIWNSSQRNRIQSLKERYRAGTEPMQTGSPATFIPTDEDIDSLVSDL